MTERLFIGGVWDGQWRPVQAGQWRILAPKESGPPLFWSGGEDKDPPLAPDTYLMHEVTLFRRRTKVFVLESLSQWPMLPDALFNALTNDNAKRACR